MPANDLMLVNATQLDADLADVADAIRAKSGGSSQLVFPSGYISEIESIQTSGYDIDELLDGSITSIVSDVTTVKTPMNRCGNLQSASFPYAASLPVDMFNGLKFLTSVSVPSVSGAITTSVFRGCERLPLIDLPSDVSSLGVTSLYYCHALTALVLRRTAGVVTMQNTTVFDGTPLTGYGGAYSGHVYVPAALLESYKTASNWSTLYANYPGIFETIEGSIYE